MKPKEKNEKIEAEMKAHKPKKERAKGDNIKRFNKVISTIKNMKISTLNPAKSVGMKLFLVIFVVIVLLAASLGITSYNSARNAIKDQAANSNEQTIIQTSDKLNIVLKQFEVAAMQILLDTEMQNNVRDLMSPTAAEYDRVLTAGKISDMLSSISNTNTAIQSIYLVPGDGKTPPIATSSVVNNISEMLNQPWYKDAVKTKKTEWIASSAKEGSVPTFKLVRSVDSIYGDGSNFSIVFFIKASALEDQLSNIDLGDGSRLEIVSADGQIVASDDTTLTGKKTTYSFVNDIKDSASGSKETTDENGRSILAAYDTIETSGWKIIGTVPTSYLVQNAKSIIAITGISIFVVAILAVLIGLWMVRLIARPLQNLQGLMKQGAAGNLNVRTAHKSKDEIGQLSDSFNEMMENITTLVTQTNATAQDVLDTASELTDASKKTAVSAKEIAVATEEIANGATSLANEAERGNELTENISHQMKNVIAANQEMSVAAQHVVKSSEIGMKNLNELIEKTNQSEEMTRSLVQRVDALQDSTKSVLKVVDVLHGIAQQTNILSLNATIEAARAGAAGRGFMVVADEIRQLADQSRKSIDMVAQITDNIKLEMNETVRALSDAYPLYQQQMNAVKETSDIFVSLTQLMEEFNSRLDSVTSSIEGLNQSQNVLSEAMSNVSAVAEESSATSEEVASLSSEQLSVGNHLIELSNKLESVSVSLKNTLSKFKL